MKTKNGSTYFDDETTSVAKKNENKDKKKEKKKDKLTVEKLKKKGAKVVEENGKLYAVYKDKNNEEMKQKINEKEAEELGYKEKEEVEAATINIGNDDTEVKTSNVGLVSGLILLLLVLEDGSYFYYKRTLALHKCSLNFQ